MEEVLCHFCASVLQKHCLVQGFPKIGVWELGLCRVLVIYYQIQHTAM